MCADENPVGRHLLEHGIENRSIASVLNGIHPYEDTIKLHELFTNFGAKSIVINGRLGLYSSLGKGSEQLRKPVIFSGCVFSSFVIARVENRDPSTAFLRHRIPSRRDLANQLFSSLF